MKQRSGVSYWQAIGAPPLAPPALAGDATCEVAIVGGGITGALVAYSLMREGVDTILLDKREPGCASTTASTGLLQYEVDTPLSDLMKRVGEAHAVRAYARGLTAIDEIERLTEELGDDCGFSRRETLYFASHFWHRRQLRREFECRQAHGFDVDFLERSELASLSSISAAATIRSRGDGQIDPYRFTQCLLARAQASGLRAFSRSEVVAIDEASDSVRLRTDKGSVAARRVVYAAGYETDRYLSHAPGTLHSTYALASEPLDRFAGWPNGCLIWETARPYFYARQTDDGRAVIGGEDTMFSTDHQRDGLVERNTARLVRRFERLFPALDFQPAYSWAGTFGESKDGMAYIGQPADRPSAYFALGYGGNGITFSVIAARLITDLYVRRPNEDAAVFRFGR